jgi:hypothetical protein
VKDVSRVIHDLLQSAVRVRDGLGATAESKTLAEVVATFVAVVAISTHDSGLDRYSLTWHQTFDTGPHRGDDAGCLVAQNEWSLESEVAVLAIGIIVYWRRIGELFD